MVQFFKKVNLLEYMWGTLAFDNFHGHFRAGHNVLDQSNLTKEALPNVVEDDIVANMPLLIVIGVIKILTNKMVLYLFQVKGISVNGGWGWTRKRRRRKRQKQ